MSHVVVSHMNESSHTQFAGCVCVCVFSTNIYMCVCVCVSHMNESSHTQNLRICMCVCVQYEYICVCVCVCFFFHVFLSCCSSGSFFKMCLIDFFFRLISMFGQISESINIASEGFQ